MSVYAIVAVLPVKSMTRVIDMPAGSLTLFAPDWIWQGQTINMIAVAENRNPATPYVLAVDVIVPSDTRARFTFQQPTRMQTNVTQRQHLLVTTFSPASDMARGSYNFTLNISAGGWHETIIYPVSVIRGSLVEAGIWSVLLPALIALLWSVVLLVILPRYGITGAWKTVPPAFCEPPDATAWFKEKPDDGRPSAAPPGGS